MNNIPRKLEFKSEILATLKMIMVYKIQIKVNQNINRKLLGQAKRILQKLRIGDDSLFKKNYLKLKAAILMISEDEIKEKENTENENGK